ncbi:hypothetical protein BDV27DRAFT_149680 [Aspergillus caelatus]|uniref:Arrestin-like N-terminal domain-containing protein n=1 Tax=Aspergillus caelatus TaxID=61420 RepID=A0A5N6ZQU0_9EURO|nr:uncharacterized protein BDV27DRAFT_149680 [Aspergillus caelatus]KAE8359336.1 hypothetical protein BDV27DRAFT_149680 [Aspergillus caelatus]
MAAVVDRCSRPQVAVTLDDQKDGVVNSYTTGDEINGNVTVSVNEDVTIDAFQITFEGISETTVEPPGTIINRTAATRYFLRLRQPVDFGELPHCRTLRRGILYTFPFNFVLPDRLLPQACDHETSNWVLKDAHARLPPTLGDPVYLHSQRTAPDDFAPTACRVSYIVKVWITKNPSDGDSQFSSNVLAAVGKKVHVIPTVDEEPPLSVQEDSAEYRPWAETLIRKGLFRTATGQLKLSADQPRPLVVQLRGCEPSVTSSILAKLNLRFDPVEDEQPPQLDTVCSQLKVMTFLSVLPFTDFPTNAPNEWNQMNRRTFQQVIPLLNIQVGSVVWQKEIETHSAQDGIFCQHGAQQKTYYTASISIPTSLPQGKSFIPTFHSCYISRIYILKLKVSYLTLSRLTGTNSIKLPIQITAGRQA